MRSAKRLPLWWWAWCCPTSAGARFSWSAYCPRSSYSGFNQASRSRLFGSNAAPLMSRGRRLSLVKTTTFFLVLCAGKFLGYTSFGFLADAFGRRKPYFAYLITAAALVPIYGMTASPILLLLLGPLVAFFGTGFFSGYAAIASEIFPGEIRAAAMGFSYNVGRGISAIAPFAVGAIAARHGIGPAFLLQAGAFFVAAVLSLMLPETRGSRLT